MPQHFSNLMKGSSMLHEAREPTLIEEVSLVCPDSSQASQQEVLPQTANLQWASQTFNFCSLTCYCS